MNSFFNGKGKLNFENGNEYRDIIKLHGSKRILEINMVNNNKKPVKIFLKYNEKRIKRSLISKHMITRTFKID